MEFHALWFKTRVVT